MMKKILMIIFVILVLNGSLTVFASTDKNNNLVKNILIDELELDSYEHKIISLIINGDIEQVLSLISKNLINDLKNNIINRNKIMYTLISLVLFSGVIKYLSKDDEFIKISIIIVICLLLLEFYTDIYKSAKDALSDIEEFTSVSIPVYLGLNTVITGKIPFINTAFLGGQNIYQHICLGLMMPGVSLSIFFSVMASLNDGFDFIGVKSIISSSINWINGIFATLFLSCLKILDLMVFSSERLMYSGIKYTLSKGIPAVGGYVSESLGALIGAVCGIGKICGSALCVILVLRVIVPILKIFTCCALLKILSCLASVFSTKSVAQLLSDVSSCVGQLSVLIITNVVIFVIGLSVIIKF